MEDLGRRAGFALENARLYGETQSAVRLRDEFISIAGHELKTPLTSMSLQISGIRRAAASAARVDVDKLTRRVDAIDKQVGRLTALVDGLLDVQPRGRRPPAPEPGRGRPRRRRARGRGAVRGRARRRALRSSRWT